MTTENENIINGINFDNFDFDSIEESLQADISAELEGVESLFQQKEDFGNPEALGDMLLNTVWEQFNNQMAIAAGAEFTKENQEKSLDLRKKAHVIDPDRFEKGELPTHNFENMEKYQKRYDETRNDFQTDPNMQVNMSANMRFNEETKTYERYDKNSKEWVGKTRYNEETKTWEDYNPRNGEWQKKLSKDARNNFDTRTSAEKGSKTVNKDHVISAAEQIRDNEASAYMDRDERQNFAKSDVNIQDLDSAANQSKSDLSVDDWLGKTREDGTTQAEHFGLDEEQIRENDEKAREAYKKEKEEAKDRAIKEGKKSQKDEALRIGKDTVKAVVMRMLSDLVKKVVKGFVAWLKAAGRTLKSLLAMLKNAITSFITDLKNQLIAAGDTAVTVIATAIWGPIVEVIKKAWMFIKQGWSSLKEAINYLKDTENRNKSTSIRMLEVGKIIIAGMTAAGSIVLSEVIEGGLSLIPGFAVPIPFLGSLANIIGMFLSGLISGIIGALAMNLLDSLIKKKMKAAITEEIVDIQNQVLEKQALLTEVTKEHAVMDKKIASDNIHNRHVNAEREMRRMLSNIEKKSESNAEKLEQLNASLRLLMD